MWFEANIAYIEWYILDKFDVDVDLEQLMFFS